MLSVNTAETKVLIGLAHWNYFWKKRWVVNYIAHFF